jgi:fucose 4-O-acetylase-like acetyltransferase
MLLQPLFALLFANGAWLEKIGNVALWFLPCLFVTESLFFLTVRTGKNSVFGIWTAVPVFALMGFIESVYLKWAAPWSVDTALMAVVFYAAGYQARTAGGQGKFGIPRSAPLKAAAAAAAFSVTAVFALLNGRVDMNTTLYGNPMYFLIAAFSGTYAVTVLAQLLPANTLLSWLGRNSLVLFGLHVPLISYAMGSLNAAAALFTEEEIVLQDDLYVILVACATLLITAAWVYVFNRFLSFLIGKGQKRGLKTLSC